MDLARAYPLFAWAGFAIVAKASRRHAPLEPQSVGLNLLPRRSVSLRAACFTGTPVAEPRRAFTLACAAVLVLVPVVMALKAPQLASIFVVVQKMPAVLCR